MPLGASLEVSDAISARCVPPGRLKILWTCRWWEGRLLVDRHVFTEVGIVRLDAIDGGGGEGVGGGGGSGGGGSGIRATDGREGTRQDELPLRLPPEGHVSISSPGREDMSATMLGKTIGPLLPGSWARKLDQMCLEVRELLKPRQFPTREEEDSRAEEWTSSTPHDVADSDEFELDEGEGESTDLPEPPQTRGR